MTERLYRHPTDRAIAGVAGGMAVWLDIDPSLIRIAWVLAAIFSGGILACTPCWNFTHSRGTAKNTVGRARWMSDRSAIPPAILTAADCRSVCAMMTAPA